MKDYSKPEDLDWFNACILILTSALILNFPVAIRKKYIIYFNLFSGTLPVIEHNISRLSLAWCEGIERNEQQNVRLSIHGSMSLESYFNLEYCWYRTEYHIYLTIFVY